MPVRRQYSGSATSCHLNAPHVQLPRPECELHAGAACAAAAGGCLSVVHFASLLLIVWGARIKDQTVPSLHILLHWQTIISKQTLATFWSLLATCKSDLALHCTRTTPAKAAKQGVCQNCESRALHAAVRKSTPSAERLSACRKSHVASGVLRYRCVARGL